MTIKEIAQLAGVSISTVSKVINHKDESIRPETRARVLQIVKECNYVPYYNTSTSAASTRTFALGILVSSVASVPLLKDMIHTVGMHGYTALISEYSAQPEQELRSLQSFWRQGVDGILWEPMNETSLARRDLFKEQHSPIVLFNSTHSDHSFYIDFEKLSYHATQELIQNKHQNIAFLMSDSSHFEELLLGYKKCLFYHEIPYQEHLIFRDIDSDLIQAISSHKITGIVIPDECTANRLYGQLCALHYRIPEDLSIITLRDSDDPEDCYPNLSAVTIPYRALAEHVCTQAIEQIEKPDHTPIPFETVPAFNHTATIAEPYSAKEKDIVVVGSINIDHYLKMDQLPHTGKSTLSSSSCVYPGGKALNQSVGVAKLGAHATLIGHVGSDPDSNLIYKTLDFYNIDSSRVKRIPNTETGKAYVFVQNDGDSTISALSAVNGLMTPEYIYEHEDAFRSASFCLIQTELQPETVLTACTLAKKHGSTVLLKAAPSRRLNTEILSRVDILLANMDEIQILRPEGSLKEKADYLLALGIQTVIITLGANGCYVRTRDTEESIPATKFHSIDNTGAGDAFISALTVYLQDGIPLSQAVRIACIAAGFSTTREGVPDALVTRDTLETYLRRNSPELLA